MSVSARLIESLLKRLDFGQAVFNPPADLVSDICKCDKGICHTLVPGKSFMNYNGRTFEEILPCDHLLRSSRVFSGICEAKSITEIRSN